jgi:hypothetical protein
VVRAQALATEPVTVPARAAKTPPTDQDIAKLSSNIEVMRLVLVKSLKRHFEALAQAAKRRGGASFMVPSPGEILGMRAPRAPDESASVGRLYEAMTAQGQNKTFDAQGYYVPKLGVLYTLDVDTPVREVDTREHEDQERTDDLWAEAEREVKTGTVLSVEMVKQKAYELDPAAIDGVVEVILSTLMNHGWRVTPLSSSSSITVVARVSGVVHGGGDSDPFRYSSVPRHVGGELVVRPLDVVVQAPVASLFKVHQETMSADEFRKHAVISRQSITPPTGETRAVTRYYYYRQNTSESSPDEIPSRR